MLNNTQLYNNKKNNVENIGQHRRYLYVNDRGISICVDCNGVAKTEQQMSQFELEGLKGNQLLLPDRCENCLIILRSKVVVK